MPEDVQQTIAEEAGLPANWVPIDRAPVVPSLLSPNSALEGPSRYPQGSLPPGYQHDTSFVQTSPKSPTAPQMSLMPLGPSGQAAVNSATKSIIIQNTTPVTPSTSGGNMNFEGVWSNTAAYAIDNVVLFNNSAYIATVANSAKEPDTNPSVWTLLSKNLNFRGLFQTQLVQTAIFGPFGSGSQTITGALATSTAGNSFVVVAYGPNRSFATLTLSDSQGNVYTQEEFNVTNVQTTAVFFTSGIKGGASNVFTLTCDGGHVMGNTKFVVYEILGTTTFGSATANITPGSGTGTSATTYAATCSAGQLVVSFLDNQGGFGYTGLNLAPGFNFGLFTSPTANEVNMNPAPSGGTITAGFNVTDTLATVFAQVTFSVNYTQNRYEPFDVVVYEGSTYVCVASTSTTPTPTNASWFELSAGTGYAQVMTASYTAVTNDAGKLLSFNISSAATLQLPAAVPSNGWYILVQNIGTGTLTISPNGLSLDNSTSSLTVNAGQGVMIYSDGLNYYTMRGLSSAGALTKIAEVVLGASQSTISFSSIPATFRNLVLVVNARCDIAVSGQNAYIEFNGDTGANYSESFFDTNGTTMGTGNSTSSSPTTCTFLFIAGASATANLCTSAKVFINNYAGTTFSKNAVAQLFTPTALGSTTGLILINQGLNWNSTAAINTILIGLTAAGNFIAGSTFTLYGEQ